MRETDKFNRLLKEREGQGKDVVILQMPRPAVIEKRLEVGVFEIGKQHLIEDYKNQLDLQYWSFSQSLPFSSFWDLSHMNARGQKIYSDWLFGEIKQHYQQ